MRAIIQLVDGCNSTMFYKSEHDDGWGTFCYNVNRAHIFDHVNDAKHFLNNMQGTMGCPPCWKTAQVKPITITICK